MSSLSQHRDLVSLLPNLRYIIVMWTITFSTAYASRLIKAIFLLMPLIVVLGIACRPLEDRWSSPPLYMDPPSAMQGSIVAVNITVPDFSLGECTYVGKSALKITHDKVDDHVTIISLQPLNEIALRAEFVVDPLADIGLYHVELICDPKTLFSGAFEVRERNTEPTLDLSVNVANAGTANLTVDISSKDTTFIEGVSHTIFGDGTTVLVTEEKVVTNNSQLRVKVNISALALIGEMEVAVVTGSVVARGVFYILDKKYASVQVEDDEILRPLPGSEPAQASLVVTGRSTWFSEISEVEDAGLDELQTEVSFPLNPGITVDMVDVNGPYELDVNIQVSDSAVLGPTPMVITTGEEIAITAFTVLPTLPAPVVEVKPNLVPRGSDKNLLFLKTTDLTLDETTAIHFLKPGCTVDSFHIITASEVAAFVSIENTFLDLDNTIEISTGSKTATASLLIEDLGEHASYVDILGTAAVPQGAVSDSLLLDIEGGLFSDEDVVEASLGSGIRIDSYSATSDGGSMVLRIDVADDAPCGPAAIDVFAASIWHRLYLEVVPLALNPHLSFDPPVLLPGRRQTNVNVQVENYTLEAGTLNLEINNPSIIVDKIENADTDLLTTELLIAPSSMAGTSVLYMQSGDIRIAGSIRLLEKRNPHAAAVSSAITRDGEETFKKILINVYDMNVDHLAASVFDGIGVTVERVSWIVGNQVELELKVAPKGPGGWLGILITDGVDRIAVPIYLNGDDDSLTAEITPDELSGWNRQLEVSMKLPPEANMDPVLSFAHTSAPDAFAHLDTPPSASTAAISVEVPYSYTDQELAIIVTAQKGAAVGVLQVPVIETISIEEAEPWSEELAQNDVRMTNIEGLEYPAMVRVSMGREGFSDLNARLLCEDNLCFEAHSKSGFLFAFAKNSKSLIFTPAYNTPGVPQSLEVISKGASMSSIAEDNDEPSMATEVKVDPCSTPFLGIGNIDRALDIDRIALSHSSCRLLVDVVARGLGERPWAIPNVTLELRDSDDLVIQHVDAWPTASHLDSRLYFDSDVLPGQIIVAGQQGTEGTYFVNIRRTSSILEVCRTAGTSFIELSMEPGTSMDTTVLKRLDPNTGVVLANLPLFGIVPEDGIVVVGDAADPLVDFDDMVGLAITDVADDFVITLSVDSKRVDAVQVGGSGDFGEGDPLVNDLFKCFFRFAGVDTNDNLYDFVGSWVGTPGNY